MALPRPLARCPTAAAARSQKKRVMCYRFVTEGTVEEKIVERAQRKLYLDAVVIQQGRLVEQDKQLDKTELQAMIRFGADAIFHGARCGGRCGRARAARMPPPRAACRVLHSVSASLSGSAAMRTVVPSTRRGGAGVLTGGRCSLHALIPAPPSTSAPAPRPDNGRHGRGGR